MTGRITFHNRQRRRRIDTRWLRQSFTRFLQHWPTKHQAYDLAIYFVSSAKITQLNTHWLNHEGPTDVITFDYTSGRRSFSPTPAALHGEIFICVEQAVLQAGEFRTTWKEELIRYIIHGILHLSGYDDLNPRARKVMKRQESHLMKIFLSTSPCVKLTQSA